MTPLSDAAIRRRIWRHPIDFIACGFGIGALPVMPGTYASAAGIGVYALMSHLSELTFIAVLVALFIIGIYVCGKANQHFGTDDHPAAVWDELATVPWAMIGLPFQWPYLLAAFALFRFFDILKPGPIGWIDRHIHGGFGVMLDDLVAALATALCLHIAHYLVHYI